MIKAITITNYLGDSLRLVLERPEESGFLIKSISGLGPAGANINTTEVSTDDGGIFNSARLKQRNIVMSLRFIQTDTETIEDLRQKTYRYFPEKKPLLFVIETDNRVLSADGYVESNEPDIFSSEEGCNISIVCPDPKLYAYGPRSETATEMTGVIPVFEFPFENDSLIEPLLIMGEIVEEGSEHIIEYAGDLDIGIKIVIYAIASASGVTIYNTRTREKFSINTNKLEALTGSGLVAGDVLIINTVIGSKSLTLVRNGVFYNVLNCVDPGSSWFTLTKGENHFAYVATTGASNLQIRITNKTVYDGV